MFDDQDRFSASEQEVLARLRVRCVTCDDVSPLVEAERSHVANNPGHIAFIEEQRGAEWIPVMVVFRDSNGRMRCCSREIDQEEVRSLQRIVFGEPKEVA